MLLLGRIQDFKEGGGGGRCQKSSEKVSTTVYLFMYLDIWWSFKGMGVCVGGGGAPAAAPLNLHMLCLLSLLQQQFLSPSLQLVLFNYCQGQCQ